MQDGSKLGENISETLPIWWQNEHDENFIIELQNYLQTNMVKPALMGLIDQACYLIVLEIIDDFFRCSSNTW